MASEPEELIAAAMRKRFDWPGWRHLHHSACIHNLSPEEQIAARGRSVDWWMRIVGRMPEQITPDQWVTQPPESPPRRTR